MVEFFSYFEKQNKIIKKFNKDIICEDEILLDSYIYFLKNIDRSKNRKVFTQFSKNFFAATINIFSANYCDGNIKAFFLKLLNDPLLYGDDNKYVYYILLIIYDFCKKNDEGKKFANSFYNRLVEVKKYYKKIYREYLQYRFKLHTENFINKCLLHYQVILEGREEMNFLMMIREKKIINDEFMNRLIEYVEKQSYDYFEKIEYILLYNTSLYKSFEKPALIKYIVEYFIVQENKSMRLSFYRLLFSLYRLTNERLLLSLVLELDSQLPAKHKIYCEIQLLSTFSDFKQLFLHYKNQIEILKQIFNHFKGTFLKKSDENLLQLILFFNEVCLNLTAYFLIHIKKILFAILRDQMKKYIDQNEHTCPVFKTEYEKFTAIFDNLLKIYQKFEKEEKDKKCKKKNDKEEEDYISILMKLFEEYSKKYKLYSYKKRITVIK